MAARPRKIVVGYDGSEASRRALDAAADLSGYGSTLAVVCVESGPRNTDNLAHAARAGVLDQAHEHLLERHISARYLRPIGDAAEELVGTARELDADLLVVGRRDRGAIGRLVGSVSAKVVRRAPCDVLVVH
jgi:nucleotide-binding universal stress UspA family protein